MSRIAIEIVQRQLESAYRSDPFHALRKNLESVQPSEWDIRPAGWSADEFGADPSLDICDLALHVAGAKVMYADRLFGPAMLAWTEIKLPTREMPAVLAWLEEGHAALASGLAALTDDIELFEERPAPWHTPTPRAHLLAIVINHDLYHSGEINRQRSLIRGSQGWDRR